MTDDTQINFDHATADHLEAADFDRHTEAIIWQAKIRSIERKIQELTELHRDFQGAYNTHVRMISEKYGLSLDGKDQVTPKGEIIRASRDVKPKEDESSNGV